MVFKWKGRARYFTIQPTPSSPQIKDRIWSYPDPTSNFKPIKDYLSFYASSGSNKAGDWKCFVEDELVGVQEGDFYGGWVTSNIQGKMKGGESYCEATLTARTGDLGLVAGCRSYALYEIARHGRPMAVLA